MSARFGEAARKSGILMPLALPRFLYPAGPLPPARPPMRDPMTTPETAAARDYSKTLFLPQTEFPMRAGLPTREPLLLERWAAREAVGAGASTAADLGSIVARCWAFRGMSLAVARMGDDGQSPVPAAALIKEMATRFEQECLEVMVRHLGRPLRADADDPYEALLAKAVQVAPSWTIRGGTNEILRSVISKGLRTR